MALYRSDTDLSTYNKLNLDEEVSYELSWHFNKMLHAQKCVKSNFENYKSHTNSNDINNNFYAKVSKTSNDHFNSSSAHRTKSGTWP